MGSIGATTIDTLATAFKTSLRGISPRRTQQSGVGWVSHDLGAPVSHRTRLYRLLWEPLGPAEPGVGAWDDDSYEYEYILHLETDYAGFTDYEIDIAADDDHAQVADVFIRLTHPTTTGLTFVDSDGMDIEEPDENDGMHRVDHRFLIRFMRARA